MEDCQAGRRVRKFEEVTRAQSLRDLWVSAFLPVSHSPHSCLHQCVLACLATWPKQATSVTKILPRGFSGYPEKPFGFQMCTPINIFWRLNEIYQGTLINAPCSKNVRPFVYHGILRPPHVQSTNVSCGVRTHAQLPAVDLKSTPLTTRAN